MGNGASAEHAKAGKQSPSVSATSSREGSRIRHGEPVVPPVARKQRASSVSFPERPLIEEAREEVRPADAALPPPVSQLRVTRARTFSDSADLRESALHRGRASVAMRASDGQLSNAVVDASLATGDVSPRKDSRKSDSKKEDLPKDTGSYTRHGHQLAPTASARRCSATPTWPFSSRQCSTSTRKCWVDVDTSQKSAAFTEPLIEARPSPVQAFDTESVKKLAVHASNGLRIPVKVVISGDVGVGKTSLLMRLCSKHKPGQFTHSPPAGTALHRDVSMKGTVYALACYGSGGQELYRTLTSSHYRGASIIIVCFSLTSMESFRSVPGWVNEARKYNKKATIAIVGCKADLVAERDIPPLLVEGMRSEYPELPVLECSAFTPPERDGSVDQAVALSLYTHIHSDV